MSRDVPDNVTSLRRLRGTVLETGQEVEVGAPGRGRRKRKKGWREHVTMLDVGVMQRLELTGGETRVFYCLLAHIPNRGGADSFVFVDEIAKELGVSVSYVSKILRDFRARNIIMTIRHGKHHVNTWLAYNGDFDSWNDEVDNEPEPIWVRNVNRETGEVK